MTFKDTNVTKSVDLNLIFGLSTTTTVPRCGRWQNKFITFRFPRRASDTRRRKLHPMFTKFKICGSDYFFSWTSDAYLLFSLTLKKIIWNLLSSYRLLMDIPNLFLFHSVFFIFLKYCKWYFFFIWTLSAYFFMFLFHSNHLLQFFVLKSMVSVKEYNTTIRANFGIGRKKKNWSYDLMHGETLPHKKPFRIITYAS